MVLQSELKELFHYCPMTGVFTRLKSTSPTARAGEQAGGDNGRGYLRVRIRGRLYMLHRLAFLYMTGAMPEGQVDHIDGDPFNNQWGNLRDVSHQENGKNQRLRSTNVSGVMGVRFRPKQGDWRAEICVNGKNKHLGLFATKDEAAKARLQAEKEYGFHPGHGKQRA